jgi:hypothetical protein
MDHPFACPRGGVHDVVNGWEVMEPWLRRQGAVESGSEERHSHLYRPGQLLVNKAEVDAVQGELELRGRVRTDQEPADDHTSQCLDALGLARVWVEEPTNVEEPPLPALVEQLQHKGLRVRLNQVLVSAFHVHVGPATPPRPADPQDFPDVRPLSRTAATGDHIKVLVLDTGLADDDVVRRQILQARCDGDPKAAQLSDPLPRSVGHGTFIAGLICRHSDGTRVEVRDVVNECGFIDDRALACQVEQVDEDVDLLNLSFGGYGLGGEMVATIAQLKALTIRNPELVIVAAAGNDGRDRPFLPAALPNVIAVGAVERRPDGSFHPTCFTNRGPWVDACAVGADVVSTFPHFSGDLAAVEPPPSCPELGASATAALTSVSFNRRARWSGTSFAAPLVTAAIAQRMTTDGRSAREAVRDLLLDPAARRIPGLGVLVEPPPLFAPGAARPGADG